MRGRLFAPALLALLPACGGDASGEPLIAGALTAEYDGEAFTPVNGFATPYQDGAVIVLGDGPIGCGSEDDREPPEGKNAAIALDALEPGTYGSVLVQMYRNEGSFEGVGSNTGSLTISAVTADSVAGEVSYSYTDDEGRTFGLAGTFEVVHCAP